MCLPHPLKRARFFHSLSQRINYAWRAERTIKIVICIALTCSFYDVKCILYRVPLLPTLHAYVTFLYVIPISSKISGNFICIFLEVINILHDISEQFSPNVPRTYHDVWLTPHCSINFNVKSNKIKCDKITILWRTLWHIIIKLPISGKIMR